MSKTIKQWLETLPEPYRTRALENIYLGKTEHICNCIEDALISAFSWENSKQGLAYWQKIYSKLTSGELSVKQLQDRITLLEAKHGVTLNAPPETQQEYQQLKKELETKIHRL